MDRVHARALSSPLGSSSPPSQREPTSMQRSAQLLAQAVPFALKTSSEPPTSSALDHRTRIDPPAPDQSVRQRRSLTHGLRRFFHHVRPTNSKTKQERSDPSFEASCSILKVDRIGNPSLFASLTPSRSLRTPPFSRSVASLSSASSSSSPPSPTSSSSACSSQIIFPLDPDFEAELEIALEMAPHSLGSAWSHDSYNAMQYLRARTPYPPTMTETAFDYHAQGDRQGSGNRWQTALEIGCGPGQMSIHLATRFAKVYGQDPSPNMLKLANTVKQMSAEELAEVNLPPVRDAARIEYSQARGEDPILPPGEKVDLIMMAACIHWMDWEKPESGRSNWQKWSSLLKPGGTLVVTGGRPVIGPYTGEMGERIRPLRDWLLDFPFDYPEVQRYYDTGNTAIEDLRKAGLYRKLPMPWEHSPDLEQLWDRSSYCWIPVDDPTVLGEKATSARLAEVDDPEQLAATMDNLPEWIRPGVRRAAWCDNSAGDLVITTTTPRKMADWTRSTSAYLKFLQENPEQRQLSLQDEDLAAVELKKLCQQIGIDFDAEIECHHSGAVLCIRRSLVEC